MPEVAYTVKGYLPQNAFLAFHAFARHLKDCDPVPGQHVEVSERRLISAGIGLERLLL
jgi:hypothetical protein